MCFPYMLTFIYCVHVYGVLAKVFYCNYNTLYQTEISLSCKAQYILKKWDEHFRLLLVRYCLKFKCVIFNRLTLKFERFLAAIDILFSRVEYKLNEIRF